MELFYYIYILLTIKLVILKFDFSIFDFSNLRHYFLPLGSLSNDLLINTVTNPKGLVFKSCLGASSTFL